MVNKIFLEEVFRNLVEWSRMGYEMIFCLKESERL